MNRRSYFALVALVLLGIVGLAETSRAAPTIVGKVRYVQGQNGVSNHESISFYVDVSTIAGNQPVSQAYVQVILNDSQGKIVWTADKRTFDSGEAHFVIIPTKRNNSIGVHTINAIIQNPDRTESTSVVSSVNIRDADATPTPAPPPVSTPTPTEDKFVPEVNIPGLFSGPQTIDNTLLGRYVRAIYVYFVWVVGILSTVMITFGGIKWVTAAGNSGLISDARDTINNAIIGLIIALTSFVLLYTINPQYTSLTIPAAGVVKKAYFDGAAVGTICISAANVACGELQKEGKVTDRNGQLVDAYCIGTTCPFGGIGIIGRRPRVCTLIQDPVLKYYRPGNGCVTSLTPENPTGEFANVREFDINQNIAKLEIACGVIAANPVSEVIGTKRSIGSLCPGDKGKDSNSCYTLGLQAKIIDNSLGLNDTISNMRCPVSDFSGP